MFRSWLSLEVQYVAVWLRQSQQRGFGLLIKSSGVSGLAYSTEALLSRRTKRIVFLCKCWLRIFNFHNRKAKQQNVFYSSVPPKLRQLARLPAPPFLYQLSLSSFDHHLNYLLSCPPDGFFANYNFFVDGRGIMTAEACAVAQQNTKRANGCRCVCRTELLHCMHTDRH